MNAWEMLRSALSSKFGAHILRCWFINTPWQNNHNKSTENNVYKTTSISTKEWDDRNTFTRCNCIDAAVASSSFLRRWRPREQRTYICASLVVDLPHEKCMRLRVRKPSQGILHNSSSYYIFICLCISFCINEPKSLQIMFMNSVWQYDSLRISRNTEADDTMIRQQPLFAQCIF